MLALRRPGVAPVIRVVDFEATGLELDALIVEQATVDLDPVTRMIGATRSTLCRVPSMPPETRAVHHIRASDTVGYPPYDRRCLYEEAARDGIVAWAAHNSSFEERYVMGSIPMICTYKAALRWWPEAPSHSVFALLYWLEDQERAIFESARAHPPHRAGPDAYATAVLLQVMMIEGATGQQLFQWTREPARIPRCPIGAWRGHKWAEIETSFLEWIRRTIYDREDIRLAAIAELDRRQHIKEFGTEPQREEDNAE